MKRVESYVIIVFSIGIFLPFSVGAWQPVYKPWTWLYCKFMSPEELVSNKAKRSLTYMKEGVPHFSQLIFSWNAMRPQRGNYVFAVQARDAHRKEWGPWHSMASWGSSAQRSEISTPEGLTSFYYVRLEVKRNSLADAFRVAISVDGGADLSGLKAVAVSLANFSEFKPELVDEHITSLPSVYIENVPQKSQFMVDHVDNDSFCSPTSCSMIASFLTGKDVDVVHYARHVFDDGLNAYGNWAFNMAHMYELTKGSYWAFAARLNSFVRLHSYLTSGMPVVLSVRGALKGASKPYPNGHLLVVVGWDAKKREVICHDPAFKRDDQVLVRYGIADFLAAWERSRRLVYLVEPTRG